jgi:hypothetical protein
VNAAEARSDVSICCSLVCSTQRAIAAVVDVQEYVSEACSDVSCRRWMVNENLQRCLTIEPPEPALKLETLSEIAQVSIIGVCTALWVVGLSGIVTCSAASPLSRQSLHSSWKTLRLHR